MAYEDGLYTTLLGIPHFMIQSPFAQSNVTIPPKSMPQAYRLGLKMSFHSLCLTFPKAAERFRDIALRHVCGHVLPLMVDAKPGFVRIFSDTSRF